MPRFGKILVGSRRPQFLPVVMVELEGDVLQDHAVHGEVTPSVLATEASPTHGQTCCILYFTDAHVGTVEPNVFAEGLGKLKDLSILMPDLDSVLNETFSPP